MSGVITILADQRTEAFLIRVSDCPGWPKPEAEIWESRAASGYVDRVLADHPTAAVRLIEGSFNDDWRPIVGVVG